MQGKFRKPRATWVETVGFFYPRCIQGNRETLDNVPLEVWNETQESGNSSTKTQEKEVAEFLAGEDGKEKWAEASKTSQQVKAFALQTW